MEPKITSHIIKGIVVVAVLIALDLFLQNSGMQLATAWQYVPTILLFLGVMISCILFAKQSGGNIKFGNVFAHGFKTTAVIACLMAVYTFFAVKYIYPQPTAADIMETSKAIQKQNNIMPAEADKIAAEGIKKMWILIVPKVIFVSVVSGALGAVAGAALAKKNQ